MKKHIALLLALLLLSACSNADASVTPPEAAGGAEQFPVLSVQSALTSPAEDEPDGGDIHQSAEGDDLDAEPEMDGNTVTKITLGYVGDTYSFWGDDSVALTDLLLHLDYDPMGVCRCPVEYTIDTEFGSGYGVNLTEAFARCEAGQVPLTQEQMELIQGIIARNCA